MYGVESCIAVDKVCRRAKVAILFWVLRTVIVIQLASDTADHRQSTDVVVTWTMPAALLGGAAIADPAAGESV